MDLILFLALFSVTVLILLSTVFIFFRSAPSKPREAQRAPVPADGDRPRRANVVQNRRNRLRMQERHDEDQENLDNSDTDLPAAGDEKMGAKKRAKLEAKELKKAARELEEKRREDNKKREAQQEEERKKLEEKEKLEEQKLEEEKKRLQEEKERREHEEYLKMKAAFSVEEEGYDENIDENELSFQNFVDHIKNNKVIVIEDLAVMFKLKTQACIERITDLQKDNILSGVMDDRGKFIYISPEELKSFAKFIKQRGRVSLTELAEGSNKLINLQPNQPNQVLAS